MKKWGSRALSAILAVLFLLPNAVLTTHAAAYTGGNGVTTVTVGDSGCDYTRLFDVFNDQGIEGDVVIQVQNDLAADEPAIMSVYAPAFTSITIESSDPGVNRGFSGVEKIEFNGVPTTLRNMGTTHDTTTIVGNSENLDSKLSSSSVTVENCKFHSLIGSENRSVRGDIHLSCSGADTDITVIYGGISLKGKYGINDDFSVGGEIDLTIDGGTYGSVYGVSNISKALEYPEQYVKGRTLTVKGDVTVSLDHATVTNLLCGQGTASGMMAGYGNIGTVLTTEGTTTLNVSNSDVKYIFGGAYNTVASASPPIPLYGDLGFHLGGVAINLKDSTVDEDVTALNKTWSGEPFLFTQTGDVTVTLENTAVGGSLLGGYATARDSLDYRIDQGSAVAKQLIGNTLDPREADETAYLPVEPGEAVSLTTHSPLTVSALGGFTDLSLGGTVTVSGDTDRAGKPIDIVDCDQAKITTPKLQDWTEGEGLIVSSAANAPALQEAYFTKGWTEEKPAIEFKADGTPGGWYLKDIPMVTATFDPAPGSIPGVTGSKALHYVKGTTLPAADIPTPAATQADTHFAGWYTDVGDESTKLDPDRPPVLNGDLTYHAKWRQEGGWVPQNYVLSFEENGGSPVKDVKKPYGAIVPLDQKTEREGYAFTGWYLDRDLTNRVSEVKLTKNTTVYAGWQEQPLIKEDHFAYIYGCPDGTFRPDEPMTRAEAAAVFYRLLADKTGTDSEGFLDVKEDAWYAQAVSVLHARGILIGCGDGTFRPEDYVTRAEFAAIVSRFESLKTGGRTFSDVPASHWAYGYIASAAERGYISGYPDGTFHPDQPISRAEAVKMTNHLLGRCADREFVDTAEGVKTFRDVPKSHWAYYEIIESSNGHDYTMKDGREVWKDLK